MKLMPLLGAALCALPTFAVPLGASPQSDRGRPEAFDRDARSFAEWVEFIRPSAKELSFEAIGWRNAFWPAVLEARALGRPILLWTMNGHPLGCT